MVAAAAAAADAEGPCGGSVLSFASLASATAFSSVGA